MNSLRSWIIFAKIGFVFKDKHTGAGSGGNTGAFVRRFCVARNAFTAVPAGSMSPYLQRFCPIAACAFVVVPVVRLPCRIAFDAVAPMLLSQCQQGPARCSGAFVVVRAVLLLSCQPCFTTAFAAMLVMLSNYARGTDCTPCPQKKGRPRAAPFNMSMFVALFQTEGCFFHVLRIGAYKHLEVAGFSAPFQVTIKELKILYRQREGYCFALAFL